MIGCPGKWPSKNGSLMVTFLSATTLSLGELDDAIDEQERKAVRQEPLRSRRRRAAVASLGITSCPSIPPARVVDADDLVGDVERRLAPHHRRVLLEHHREVLALGDRPDHRLQLARRCRAVASCSFCAQVLLQARVGLLQLDEAILELLLLLRQHLGLHERRFLSRSSFIFFSSSCFSSSSFCFWSKSFLSLSLAFLPSSVSSSARCRSTKATLVVGERDRRRQQDRRSSDESETASVSFVSRLLKVVFALLRLEEVADRELEDDRVFARLRVERNAPLEAERADRREPAEAEAHRVAQVA